jgi:branched-chain amino acid transport system substrate-binding protein
VTGGQDGSGTLGQTGPGSKSSANAIASHEPVLVGEVGTWSGVIGSALAPARDAFGAWVASVNARGGVMGHPIKLFVADDGGDPATDISQIHAMVESQHVMVLANLFPPAVNDSSVAKYAQQKNIAVIGGADGNPVWTQSPVMFPTISSAEAGSYGYAKAMLDHGSKKVGSIYCTETPICKLGNDIWAKYASRLGLQVVYEGQISVTQPDFTAQCLQASRNGAQSMIVFADASSVGRFADACSRQGYHPLIVNPLPVTDSAKMASLDGSVSVIAGFPWFITSGSPALSEYGRAIAHYDPNPTGALSGTGWTAGKALELALERSLAQSTNPSSAGIFKGLWSFRGETLGGLTPPLTFSQGQPSPEVLCAHLVKVSGGQWVAPQGVQAAYCKP